MTTREQIVGLADTLIRDQGYNAFSFNDISKTVGIRTASIHYHFPTKSDLGIAVIERHIAAVGGLIERIASEPPEEQLNKFFSIYSEIKAENKVCLVGSLATDFNTLDEKVRQKLGAFSELILHWVSGFLNEGRNRGVFGFEGTSRTKALMIVSNMLAIVQLSRLTGNEDFETVKETIRKDLVKKQA